MKHGDRDDRRDIEPYRDIEVLLVALRESPEEVDREYHPDQGNCDVDRPFELGIFLCLTEAERQRDDGRYDDGLPAPEVDLGERVGGEARLQDTLRRVV